MFFRLLFGLYFLWFQEPCWLPKSTYVTWLQNRWKINQNWHSNFHSCFYVRTYVRIDFWSTLERFFARFCMDVEKLRGPDDCKSQWISIFFSQLANKRPYDRYFGQHNLNLSNRTYQNWPVLSQKLLKQQCRQSFIFWSTSDNFWVGVGYTCTSTETYTYVRIHTHVRTCATQLHTQAHTYTCTLTYQHIHIHTRIRIRTYA